MVWFYSSFTYVYQYTDLLNNARLNYTNVGSRTAPNLQIRDENHYYPFGMKHQGYGAGIIGTQNDYKYNGKEYQDEIVNGKRLDWYDYGARNYNPTLGRWSNVDPLAEFMRSHSPYNYGFNNPVYFADYEGTIPWPLPYLYKVKNDIWKRKAEPDDGFRWRVSKTGKKKFHYGVDLNYDGGGDSDLGAPIVATHSGRVARIIPLSERDGGGRIVVVSSPDGSFETKYMHLSSVTVKPGQEISEGQTIGLMGGSGFGRESAYTAHLHYEIHRNTGNGLEAINPWQNGSLVDPQSWISSSSQPNYPGLDAATEFLMNLAPWAYNDPVASVADGLDAQPAASTGNTSMPTLRPGAKTASSVKAKGVKAIKTKSKFSTTLVPARRKPFKGTINIKLGRDEMY